MPDRPQGRRLVGLGMVLGGCLLGAGCRTTPLTAVSAGSAPTVRLTSAESRPDPATVRVQPGTLLRWRATSAKDAKNPGAQGESAVRADGALDLGPYGVVTVGGLTLKQASDAIARHLGKYIPEAKVHVAAYLRPQPAVAAAARRTTPLVSIGRPQAGPVAQTGYQPPPDVPANPGPADAALVTGAPPDEPGAGKPKSGEDKRSKDKAGAGEDKQGEEKTGAGEDKPGKGKSAAPGAMAGTWPAPGAGPELPPPGHADGGLGLAPNELSKVSLPPYRIEPPDLLLVDYIQEPVGIFRYYEVRGPHLVRPDGTISLGPFGAVHVAGLTIEQARVAVLARLQEVANAAPKEEDRGELDLNRLNVDVLAYNSKVYYVITDGAGYGAQVYRLPIYGSETVLDALAQVGGLPPVASKKRIWVARRTPDGGPPKILPVDYCGTAECGLAGTNYQVMPGDRIYVGSDPVRWFDTEVAKVLSPIERVFGFTLLGAETITAVKTASKSAGSSTTP